RKALSTETKPKLKSPGRCFSSGTTKRSWARPSVCAISCVALNWPSAHCRSLSEKARSARIGRLSQPTPQASFDWLLINIWTTAAANRVDRAEDRILGIRERPQILAQIGLLVGDFLDVSEFDRDREISTRVLQAEGLAGLIHDQFDLSPNVGGVGFRRPRIDDHDP